MKKTIKVILCSIIMLAVVFTIASGLVVTVHAQPVNPCVRGTSVNGGGDHDDEHCSCHRKGNGVGVIICKWFPNLSCSWECTLNQGATLFTHKNWEKIKQHGLFYRG